MVLDSALQGHAAGAKELLAAFRAQRRGDLLHDVDVAPRRLAAVEELEALLDLLAHRDAVLVRELVRDGVEGYSLDDCWRSYRLNLFRVLINIMYVTYDQFVKQKKRGQGMFANKPTKADAKLRDTYDACNRRMAAALA